MPALLTSETPQAPERLSADGPEQGVIEEARRRQRLRRMRILVSAVTIIAGLGAAVVFTGGTAVAPDRPLRLPPEPAPIPPAALVRGHVGSVAVRLVPNLEGAQAGWCVRIIQRDGLSATCAPLPTDSTPLLVSMSVWGAGERDDTTVVVTAPGVWRVRFSDGRTAPALASYGLPYGLRVAVQQTPHSTKPRLSGAVAAFDRGGRHIPEKRVLGSGLPWLIWNRPAAPPRGACQLRVSNNYTANPERGQVAARILPYPGRVVGRGFLSCIDTEYYVPGRGMRASVLLDAARPGSVTPALIPGLAPVPGLPGIYNTAEDYGFEPITARRQGNAWIVIAGGGRNSEEARIRLIRQLTASVQL